MNVFSIIFSILFVALSCLFIYKSIYSIIKTIKENKANKKNKTIEVKDTNNKKDN